MANPQAENGHVDIANAIFDHLCQIRVPGEARQVLDFIIRKTYGWHKKEDAISLSQFNIGTNLSKVHVCRSLKILLSMNLVTQKGNAISRFTKKGNDDSVIYGFQKDFEKWVPLPKKVTLPKKVMDVTQKGNTTLPNWDTTKETSTKETSTKEKILPDVKIFIDFYFEEFKRNFGSSPIIEGGKDGVIIKRLLKTIPLEELKTLLDRFFTSQDKFIQQSGYTLGVFKSQIQKLRIGDQKQSGLKSWAKEIMEEEDGMRQKTVSGLIGLDGGGVQRADDKGAG